MEKRIIRVLICSSPITTQFDFKSPIQPNTLLVSDFCSPKKHLLSSFSRGFQTLAHELFARYWKTSVRKWLLHGVMSQTMSNRPQPGTVSAGHSSRNGVYQNRSHNVKPLGVYPKWNIQHVLVHVISGVSNICGHLKSTELFGMIPEIDHDRSWCMIFRSLQHRSYRWNEWIVTFTNPNKKHASLLWSIKCQ